MRRSVKLKPPRSFLAPVSFSRRTVASAVPTSACALATSRWLIPNSFVNRERATLIGLTCLTNNGRVLVAPKLNRRRAVFVLSKIDEILAWEKATDRERDSKFVELGRYLCEVRASQYWNVNNVRSFDEFLERTFPESRRKAYYLVVTHEHLTPVRKRDLELIGWTKAPELAKVAPRDRKEFDCAACAEGQYNASGGFQNGKLITILLAKKLSRGRCSTSKPLRVSFLSSSSA